jgi:hypothetical protein
MGLSITKIASETRPGDLLIFDDTDIVELHVVIKFIDCFDSGRVSIKVLNTNGKIGYLIVQRLSLIKVAA